MKGIRTILIDFGNVIIDISEATTRLGSPLRLGIRATEAPELLTDIVHRYKTGLTDTSAFVQNIRMYAWREVPDSDVIEAWNSMLTGNRLCAWTLKNCARLSGDFGTPPS